MDNTQHRHDWLNTWQYHMTGMNEVSTTQYWDKRAEDYDDFIRTSEFEYGRRMCEILEREGTLDRYTQVLEIASGVGAVTLPLCRSSQRVTAIEPSHPMAERLQMNSRTWNISNLEIIEQTFQEFAADAPPNGYDMVFMCHASWQFPDLADLIASMNRLGRQTCCLADTMGIADFKHQDMYRRLDIVPVDLDRALYVFNILCELGCSPNLATIDHVMRRSTTSAKAMWRNLVGKYRVPKKEDMTLIDSHVKRQSSNGIYATPSTMALIWWDAS